MRSTRPPPGDLAPANSDAQSLSPLVHRQCPALPWPQHRMEGCRMEGCPWNLLAHAENLQPYRHLANFEELSHDLQLNCPLRNLPIYSVAAPPEPFRNLVRSLRSTVPSATSHELLNASCSAIPSQNLPGTCGSCEPIKKVPRPSTSFSSNPALEPSRTFLQP